ncbi:MAG: four helix bundle protein [Armatimonadota bacterium]
MGKETGAVINSFRDLRVWQTGMNLVESVYRITQALPKSELYGLTGQMRRAAVSVPSNIAEGHVREHLKEYLQHIAMAQGSLAELQTQFEIAYRLGYIAQSDFQELSGLATALAKQLYCLRNALASKSSVPVSVP